ncbi:MAG: hypothetical protein DRP72_00730, partial [Candidatus Omnitrophota bacterium]
EDSDEILDKLDMPSLKERLQIEITRKNADYSLGNITDEVEIKRTNKSNQKDGGKRVNFVIETKDILQRLKQNLKIILETGKFLEKLNIKAGLNRPIYVFLVEINMDPNIFSNPRYFLEFLQHKIKSPPFSYNIKTSEKDSPTSLFDTGQNFSSFCFRERKKEIKILVKELRDGGKEDAISEIKSCIPLEFAQEDVKVEEFLGILPQLVKERCLYPEVITPLFKIAFIRNLPKIVQENILSMLEKEEREWLSRNLNKSLEEILTAIEERLGRKLNEKEKVIRYIRVRDNIFSIARALKIGIETQNLNPQIIKEIVKNRDILKVIFEIKPAAIINRWDDKKMKLLKELLWSLRQIEGVSINVLELPDKRLYIYNEYVLKKQAIKQGLVIAQTTQGLEHLIVLDMIKKEGLFYDLLFPASYFKDIEDLIDLEKDLLLRILKEKFVRWDKKEKIWRGNDFAQRIIELEPPKLETIYLATMNRPQALRKELEVELENHKIFNRRIPIVVIDDSRQEILKINRETIEDLKVRYGREIVHITGEDREKYHKQIAEKLALEFSEKLRTGKLDEDIEQILKKNGILRNGEIVLEELKHYLEGNVFFHISGVRNFTVLIGKGESVIMNIDDDAPSETYLLRKEERASIRKERLDRKNKLIRELIEKVGERLEVDITNKEELYKIWTKNRENLYDLEEIYFGFSEDGRKGLIPQAMGEIVALESLYIDKEFRLTHQRYQSLMEPLPRYAVRMSDFVYKRPRLTKENMDVSQILPVNTIKVTSLVSRKVEDIYLPVVEKDLRGTQAIVITDKERLEKKEKEKIYYIAYPFILDQDTGGLAQFMRYLEMKEKIYKNLQHTDQAAFILEGVGGFVADSYVIFNRAALENIYPFPSIGRDLRLEEPPYILWVVKPLLEGKVCMGYSPVGGGQIREIGEREYMISYQDFTEIVGGVVRRFYEQAVDSYYKKLTGLKSLEERFRILGKSYIEVAKELKLDRKVRDNLLEERRRRAALASELGIQRAEKESPLVKAQTQEAKDMDLVLIQYATTFSCYLPKKCIRGKLTLDDDYSPATEEDYFYLIELKGNKLYWRRVIPEIKLAKPGLRILAEESEWKLLEEEGVVELDKEKWRPYLPLSVESGREMVLKRLPPEGVKAVVVAVRKDLEKEYLNNIAIKACDQIRKDGEMILIWPEIVKAAYHWREFINNSEVKQKDEGNILLPARVDKDQIDKKLLSRLDGRKANVSELIKDLREPLDSLVKKELQSKYTAGSFRQSSIKGTFNYVNFRYGSISATKLEERRWEIKDEGYEPEDRKKDEYKKALNILFNPDVENSVRDEFSAEELYSVVLRLRGRNPKKSLNIPGDLKEWEKEMESLLENNKYSNLCKLLAFADFSKRPSYQKIKERLGIEMEIDDSSELFEKLKNRKKLVWITGNVYGLFADLLFIQALMKKGIVEKVYLVSERLGREDEATTKGIRLLLKKKRFSFLKRKVRKRKVKIIDSGSKGVGIDLRQASKEFKKLINLVKNNKAILVAKGELNNLTLNLLDAEHYRIALAEERITIQFSGLFWDENENEFPYPFVIRIPPSIMPAEEFSGKSKVRQSLVRFYKARKRYEEEGNVNYESVLKKMLERKITFAECVAPEVLLVEELSGQEKEEFRKEVESKEGEEVRKLIEEKNLKIISEKINKVIKGKGEYFRDIYKLNSDKPRSTGKKILSEVKSEEKVLVNGIVIDFKNTGLKLEVGKADEVSPGEYSAKEKRELIQPQKIAEEYRECGVKFIFNLLYFFTRSLFGEYNEFREKRGRSEERLPDEFKNVYIDTYLKDKELALPLYNKGFVAFTNKGELIAGCLKLGRGRFYVNEKEIFKWKEENIIDKPLAEVEDLNEKLKSEDILVFTPMCSDNIEGKYENRRIHTSLTVGEKRVNILVVDNEIVFAKEGDVLISCIGNIFSLKEMYFNDKLKKYFTEEQKGFYRIEENLNYKFEMDVPEELKGMINNWSDLEWLMGGGNLLVYDGKNLVKNENVWRERFKFEGWLKETSTQTQETQLTWDRGPRIIMGMTKEGKFFVFTFDGRTESKGVRFDEAIQIIYDKLGENNIDWALNLDDGSSVSLSVVENGKAYVINYPAPGPDNWPGKERPINSFCIIIKNSTSDTQLSNRDGGFSLLSFLEEFQKIVSKQYVRIKVKLSGNKVGYVLEVLEGEWKPLYQEILKSRRSQFHFLTITQEDLKKLLPSASIACSANPMFFAFARERGATPMTSVEGVLLTFGIFGVLLGVIGYIFLHQVLHEKIHEVTAKKFGLRIVDRDFQGMSIRGEVNLLQLICIQCSPYILNIAELVVVGTYVLYFLQPFSNLLGLLLNIWMLCVSLHSLLSLLMLFPTKIYSACDGTCLWWAIRKWRKLGYNATYEINEEGEWILKDNKSLLSNKDGGVFYLSQLSQLIKGWTILKKIDVYLNNTSKKSVTISTPGVEKGKTFSFKNYLDRDSTFFSNAVTLASSSLSSAISTLRSSLAFISLIISSSTSIFFQEKYPPLPLLNLSSNFFNLSKMYAWFLATPSIFSSRLLSFSPNTLSTLKLSINTPTWREVKGLLLDFDFFVFIADTMLVGTIEIVKEKTYKPSIRGLRQASLSPGGAASIYENIRKQRPKDKSSSSRIVEE